MRKRIKSVLQCFAAVAIGILGFLMLQRIVLPRFSSTEIVDGFYQEEKNSMDVLFVGSSNMFCTIDPVTLYEEQGITAYDFGSSMQSLNLSLLYIKEALKYQSPKVIALEVLTCSTDYYGQMTEEAMRWGFTNLKFSLEKCKTIYEELGKIDFEYLSYLFPFFRYKDRWKELNGEDIAYLAGDKANNNKGFYYTTEIAKTSISHSVYEKETEFTLAESNRNSLTEIAQFCREKGIELLLFKSPTAKTWTKSMSYAVAELAAELDVPFLEMNDYMEEMEINYETDFRDESHLNYSGAKKATSYMGQYLMENYDLPDKRGTDNSWNTAVVRREGQLQKEKLQSCDNITEYFKILEDSPFLYVITANGETADLAEKMDGTLERIGISREKLENGGSWIVKNGVLKTELLQPQYQYYEDLGAFTLTLSAVSGKEDSGPDITVALRRNDYFNIEQGIHVLVYDQDMDELADCVGFDVVQEGKGLR